MDKAKLINSVYDFSSVLLSAVLAVTVIFTFLFKISSVSGASMENTLHNGDTVVISALNYNLKTGDVVVISQPNGYGKVLIKRIIAAGGQTVSFDREQGTVLVDGEALDEPYIKEEMLVLDSFDKTYFVPEGCFFVMGDNRNESADSRDKRVGLIDERYIMGKVLYKTGDTHYFNKELRNG